MKSWLIKKLGGYTVWEYQSVVDDCTATFREMTRRGDTILELQALIPVPTVPKKRGRPRKIV